MSLLQTERDFKDIQQEYDHLFAYDQVRDDDRGYQWHARCLLKSCPNVKWLLDVACGGGYFLREFEGVVGKGRSALIGIDLSREALRIAQSQCPQAHRLLSVGESLPFRNQTFDAITCLGSLEHFLDIQSAVREMTRVMKDDGSLYVLVPNMFWYKDLISVFFTGDKKDRNQTQERFATLGEWRRTLEDAGVRVVRTEKYNGIARSAAKQWLKDILIPLRFSYHFVFICRKN